ncbi:MAG TPA: hypothetical protein VGM39_01830 [Kofleriaceae bacterium]|jgi:hypothetical protein
MQEADHVSRIVERLRKDHPDPAERAKLYDDGLPAYVSVLMNGEAVDNDTLERMAKAVRAAEDGARADPA